jgi:hypothetical protein
MDKGKRLIFFLAYASQSNYKFFNKSRWRYDKCRYEWPMARRKYRRATAEIGEPLEKPDLE